MVNIFINGPMGSGKTTIAKHLEFKGYRRVSIAAPLKELERQLREDSFQVALNTLHRLCYSVVYAEAKRNNKKTTSLTDAVEALYKKASVILKRADSLPIVDSEKQVGRMQVLGYDMRSEVNPDFWLNLFYLRILACDVMMVCDDVRYLNEAQLLSAMGWHGLLLDVSEVAQIKRLKDLKLPHSPKVLHNEGEQECRIIREAGLGTVVNADLECQAMLRDVDVILELF